MGQGFLIGLDGSHVHSLLPLSCSEHPPAMAVFASHIPHTPPAQPFSCLAGPQTLRPGQLICNGGMGKGQLRSTRACGVSGLARIPGVADGSFSFLTVAPRL